MSKSLFEEGGPHRIKSLGNDQYSMAVSIPSDENGRTARECPNSDCSPGYFKVTTGTGITGGQITAYCPYCRHEGEPNDFTTQEQLRYAKDLVTQEARKGVDKMFRDAFGPSRKIGGDFISMEISYKPGSIPHVWHPFEEEVRRDVVCPHCTLNQTVFGLATWCADCGEDIFLTHVETELGVTRLMVKDVERRETELGKRVAVKDLENCLEDAVSIFEASTRAIVRRALIINGDTPEQVDVKLKKLGSTFQNIERTQKEVKSMFDCDPFAGAVLDQLISAFEKRHPITHNLGVVDKKYMKRVQQAEQEGREVRITVSEVSELLSAVFDAVSIAHKRLIGN